jgi:hypothetical protein
LVSRGHDFEAVVERYSVRKINALCDAAYKNMEHEMKMTGIASRVGVNSDKEEFNRWLKG